MKRNIKGIMTVAVLAVFGLATIAFAGWGGGYGRMMGPMMGPGWQQGGGYYGNLSAAEIEKLDQQRTEFFKATEAVRQQLYEKDLALQNELAKENPDTSKASGLQSEISKLQSDLDQKRLDYEIRTRKSAPGNNRGSRGYGPMKGYGPMMGYGPMKGYGPMMGYGPGGGGYCTW